jgi:hypothetical protein
VLSDVTNEDEPPPLQFTVRLPTPLVFDKEVKTSYCPKLTPFMDAIMHAALTGEDNIAHIMFNDATNCFLWKSKK